MTSVLPGALAHLVAAAEGCRFVFISPHLDDAVLSCGALIAALSPTAETLVVTVFTEASPPPWSRPARSFIRTCGATDGQELYVRRRAEDTAAVDELGAQSLHLGLTDALFRRRNPDELPDPAPHTARTDTLSRLRHRSLYPTYHLDMARGWISSHDRPLVTSLAERFADLAGTPGTILFAPMSIGDHVDHRLVRDAARHLEVAGEAPPPVVYYSDFPYSVSSSPDRDFVRTAGIAPYLYTSGRRETADHIARYATQFRPLFPSGVVPFRPEVYWTKPPA